MKLNSGFSSLEILLTLMIIFAVFSVYDSENDIKRSFAASNATWDALDIRAETKEQKRFVSWTRVKCKTPREARRKEAMQKNLDSDCLQNEARVFTENNLISVDNLHGIGLVYNPVKP